MFTYKFVYLVQYVTVKNTKFEKMAIWKHNGICYKYNDIKFSFFKLLIIEFLNLLNFQIIDQHYII